VYLSCDRGSSSFWNLPDPEALDLAFPFFLVKEEHGGAAVVFFRSAHAGKGGGQLPLLVYSIPLLPLPSFFPSLSFLTRKREIAVSFLFSFRREEEAEPFFVSVIS